MDMGRLGEELFREGRVDVKSIHLGPVKFEMNQ